LLRGVERQTPEPDALHCGAQTSCGNRTR
jgi:hypothetical protein